jgi:hypothetical protein
VEPASKAGRLAAEHKAEVEHARHAWRIKPSNWRLPQVQVRISGQTYLMSCARRSTPSTKMLGEYGLFEIEPKREMEFIPI